MTTGEPNVAEQRERESGDEGEPKPLLDAVHEASEELRLALQELYLRNQRRDFEAKLECTRAMQEAEFDHRKAEAEAYWSWMDASRGIAADQERAGETVEQSFEYQRGAQERAIEVQRRAADSGRAYAETMEAAQREFLEDLHDIHRSHVARLKEIWAEVDPDSVRPEELAVIGQVVGAAAQSMPPPRRTAAAREARRDATE